MKVTGRNVIMGYETPKGKRGKDMAGFEGKEVYPGSGNGQIVKPWIGTLANEKLLFSPKHTHSQL